MYSRKDTFKKEKSTSNTLHILCLRGKTEWCHLGQEHFVSICQTLQPPPQTLATFNPAPDKKPVNYLCFHYYFLVNV